MGKQIRSFTLNASFALLLTAITGIGAMQPATAHPYQIFSLEEYRQEQAKWRDMIKHDPKNPELYLKLAGSHRSEAGEGYWCETEAIAVYREAIAAIPNNARLHLELGGTLLSEPFRCDDTPPEIRQAEKQEGLFHLRKAIAIATETASPEDLYKAAEALAIENR